MSMENLIGKIIDYDGEYLTIRVPYGDRDYILDHKVTSCGVTLDDGLHISSAQNRALHATFRDIADYTGNPEELTKETLKVMYSKEKGIPYFSLAGIGMDDAGRFLDWVLGWCVGNDIPLSDKLSARCADSGRMMYACVMAKRCAVCGVREAERFTPCGCNWHGRKPKHGKPHRAAGYGALSRASHRSSHHRRRGFLREIRDHAGKG